MAAIIGMDEEKLQEVCQDFVRVEIFFGERPRGSRVARVIQLQRLDAREYFVVGLEREQSGSSREEATESGFLRNDRPARRQVADAPVAEPRAPRGHITALRNAKLGLRRLDKALVLIRSRRNVCGID